MQQQRFRAGDGKKPFMLTKHQILLSALFETIALNCHWKVSVVSLTEKREADLPQGRSFSNSLAVTVVLDSFESATIVNLKI